MERSCVTKAQKRWAGPDEQDTRPCGDGAGALLQAQPSVLPPTEPCPPEAGLKCGDSDSFPEMGGGSPSNDRGQQRSDCSARKEGGSPDPLSNQAVRALPPMLSRQTQERGSVGCRCPPQARRTPRGRRDLTWRGHTHRRGAQRLLSAFLVGPVAPGVWLSLAAGQAGRVRRVSTDSSLPLPLLPPAQKS